VWTPFCQNPCPKLSPCPNVCFVQILDMINTLLVLSVYCLKIVLKLVTWLTYETFCHANFKFFYKLNNEFFILVFKPIPPTISMQYVFKASMFNLVKFCHLYFQLLQDNGKSKILHTSKTQTTTTLSSLPISTPTSTLSCHLSNLKVKLMVCAKTCLLSGKRLNLFPLRRLLLPKPHLFIFLIGLR